MFSLDSFGKQADLGRFRVNQHIICVNPAKFGKGLTIYIYIRVCEKTVQHASFRTLLFYLGGINHALYPPCRRKHGPPTGRCWP